MDIIGTIASILTAIFAGYGALMFYLDRRSKIVLDTSFTAKRHVLPESNQHNLKFDESKPLRIFVHATVHNETDRKIYIKSMRVFGIPLFELDDYQKLKIKSYKDGFERPALESIERKASSMVALEVNPDWVSLPVDADCVLQISVTIDRNTRVASRVSRTARSIVPAETIKANTAIIKDNSSDI